MRLHVLVLRSDTANMFGHRVLATVTGPMNEPYAPLATALQGRVHHADHRGQADTATQKDQRPLACRVEVKFATRRPDNEFRAHLHMIMEIGGRYAGGASG